MRENCSMLLISYTESEPCRSADCQMYSSPRHHRCSLVCMTIWQVQTSHAETKCSHLQRRAAIQSTQQAVGQTNTSTCSSASCSLCFSFVSACCPAAALPPASFAAVSAHAFLLSASARALVSASSLAASSSIAALFACTPCRSLLPWLTLWALRCSRRPQVMSSISALVHQVKLNKL